ncbi:hypothetical protein BU26DRAFT_293802 [Trematosphaeria pertusa]|uniref:Uncharacterized protein n=1 Tax=Trematosphaeria pertusa TaxID=390896 RepID=A0A6A6IHB6_9PLEO|nr:uncharacterized protein BU26DRAFT_293802 [Trematosphaeria pertusa]KAF2249984.1 hypothetical protein BU26DRAFT_293802 [Trematosphaeria pertusa]
MGPFLKWRAAAVIYAHPGNRTCINVLSPTSMPNQSYDGVGVFEDIGGDSYDGDVTEPRRALSIARALYMGIRLDTRWPSLSGGDVAERMVAAQTSFEMNHLHHRSNALRAARLKSQFPPLYPNSLGASTLILRLRRLEECNWWLQKNSRSSCMALVLVRRLASLRISALL